MDNRFLVAVCALLFAGLAQAQSAGVVTLSVTPTSGQGSVTPRLTWSTNPVATSCTASGGWSGTKAASGAQTLSAINANTNYTLTCTWGVGSATVNWTAPTTNTNGTPLTNLARFKVLYGTSSTNFTRYVAVDDPTRRSAVVNSLTPGTWYFSVRAVNASGAESVNSNVASRTVTGASAARTVSVAVTQTSGTLVTTATNVWDYYTRSDGVLARRTVVGQIALGRPCNSGFRVSTSHYEVSRSDVTLYATPQSTRLVTLCEVR
jgi:hypothetical protein